MKLNERIMPCICIDHAPDYGDSGTYGMPELKVYSCGLEGEYGYRYIPYCPRCGRGGCSDFKSDYSALKYWNELQRNLWHSECEGLLEDVTGDAPEWKMELFRKLTTESRNNVHS